MWLLFFSITNVACTLIMCLMAALHHFILPSTSSTFFDFLFFFFFSQQSRQHSQIKLRFLPTFYQLVDGSDLLCAV